jgi:hypothetical protein
MAIIAIIGALLLVAMLDEEDRGYFLALAGCLSTAALVGFVLA